MKPGNSKRTSLHESVFPCTRSFFLDSTLTDIISFPKNQHYQIRRNGTMTTPSNTLITACLQTFDSLTSQAKQPAYRHEAYVSSASWTHELNRLKDLTSDGGAQQKGKTPLEAMLGATPSYAEQKTKEHITKLLVDLNQQLRNALEEFPKDSSPSDTSPEQRSELQELHEDVVNIIDGLDRLSTHIRRLDDAREGIRSGGS